MSVIDHTADLSLEQLDAFFTGNRQFKQDTRIIVTAEGIDFPDARGRKIFDGLSGAWT